MMKAMNRQTLRGTGRASPFQVPILFLVVLPSFLVSLSCLNSDDDEASAPAGPNPHPPGWAAQGKHGQSYLDSKSSCASSCHGEALDGGISGVSCTECHKDYPHPSGWATPTAHGPPSRGEAALNRCATCHGTDFKGGFARIGCLSCHPAYPHPADWAEPRSHGAGILEAGDPASCATSCHGADYNGGSTGLSCFSCHENYPHGESWAQFDRHGSAAKPQASTNCASVCHGDDFRGGDTGVSCFACHAVYPHGNWFPYGNHYAWVRQFGETGCLTAQGCHNTYRGPVYSPPPDCTSLCHRPADSAAARIR